MKRYACSARPENRDCENIETTTAGYSFAMCLISHLCMAVYTFYSNIVLCTLFGNLKPTK